MILKHDELDQDMTHIVVYANMNQIFHIPNGINKKLDKLDVWIVNHMTTDRQEIMNKTSYQHMIKDRHDKVTNDDSRNPRVINAEELTNQ